MKNTAACVVLGLGLLSAGGMASAIQYSWNLNTTGTSGLGDSLNFGSSPTGKTLKVYAFETDYSDGSGKLEDARVVADGSWGLGVRGSGESDWPDNYTLDNSGKDQVLVFDSQMANFDWSSLDLGYIYSGDKLTYWAGDGGTGFDVGDFNDFCLRSTCSSGTVLGAAGSGFTSSTVLGLASSMSLTGNNSGRYLVVSGQLPSSNGFEKFKVSSAGGYGQAPEPQSLALIGIGLLAMLGLRRRSSITRGRTEPTPA
ncbi:MAG: PEP-CTERM sorting domain-containing protein [Betaproteobacteria bacterium]|nr:PEP-CTERM sorting domain-containing protein [Betaproteobacteria bacterium]